MESRRLHRSVMTVMAVLMMYLIITGLGTALVDATDRHQTWSGMGGGPGARLTDFARTAVAVPPPSSLSVGIKRSLEAGAGHDIASVDYRMTGQIPRLQLAESSGERNSELRFYAATGEPMTQRVADGNPFGPMPDYARVREGLKALHKGDAGGLLLQTVELLTGLSLVVMIISGVILYLKLWRARARVGKGAFFWAARESRWRTIHRAVAIVTAVFLLNKAVTGVILGWGEIQIQLAIVHHILPVPYPMPTPMPPFSEARLAGDALQELQVSYDAAKAAAPTQPIVAVQLVQRSGQTKGLVTLGGADPRILVFDPVTGQPAADWASSGVQVGNGYYADWHQVLKRMHRGDIIGTFYGRYIDIFFGFVLLYLVVSGCVMYLQMLAQRRAAGRTGWFWR